MRTTTFGRILEALPLIGQGTWEMGESRRSRAQEVRALQLGLELGMNLIDTAEMYASGDAEEVVGEAIAGRRDGVFLVSKVLPQNASRKGTVKACERSLKRLGVETIDLYLLHWPGEHPLADTIAAFRELRDSGKIRYWGVSNLRMDDLAECERIAPGENATNQVLYNLQRRGIEADMVPWCHPRGVLIMAYSPLDQGRLRKPKQLKAVAARHNATPEQVALAWSVRNEGVVTIPKSSNETRLRQNAAAAELLLTPQDLAELDEAFPPPRGPVELETA
ncbi:MAG: putative oxidoreductase [Planctomycetes bacterium]|nr:putative oxidoreductase [Planctomycetota bacterium]